MKSEMIKQIERYNEDDETIYVESFIYEEYQEPNSKELLELYGKNNDWKCYLFTSRLCFYPLSFIDKYKKLWKWHADLYNLGYECTIEKETAFERYYVFYGVAKIKVEQVDKALDIMKNDFMNSLLLFTRESRNLKDLLNYYIPSEKCEFDYDTIVSTECRSNNHIVRIVVGNNGTSINHFFKNNDVI